MNKTYLTSAVLIVLAAGAGFFGGMKYQQSQRPNFPAGNFASRNSQRNGQNNFRPVAGQILSVDDKSITVKLSDGSSKIVLLTGSTTLSQSATASATDLKVGENVAAFGTDNSDGSVTAANIQINPMFRLGTNRQ